MSLKRILICDLMIFHLIRYQVENFAILPTQRDRWPELIQVEALRTVQMEGAEEFRPWEEPEVIVEARTEEDL